MSKGNGRARTVHTDRLAPSSREVLELLAALEPRFLTVHELYGRMTGGEPLSISSWMQQHFVRWRTVVVRHRRGDPRNTSSEWQSMKEVAQWSLDEHCRLRGQGSKRLIWTE